MRSAHLKRENSKRASISQNDKSNFYDSDEEENIFERRKGVSSKLASRANTCSSTRNERTSLNSVLSQYRGDDDLGSQSSEPPSGSKRWGDITDVTFGQQNRKPKGPLDNLFFSRKSFKEIGCSDDILRAFKNFEFPRPSHIQVNDLCQNIIWGHLVYVTMKKSILNSCICELNPNGNISLLGALVSKMLCVFTCFC